MNAVAHTVQPAAPEEAVASPPLRPADKVMRLERLGSFHQTRLSFLRTLLRRLHRERWTVTRVRWEFRESGEGVGVYEARGNSCIYSLVAFAHDLDPGKRTDRVIAEEWDATFVLHDGRVTDADIERLSQNVPKQEAGRLTASEIIMARANRSVRLFNHVVGSLARGEQPDPAILDAVGYLMRTTAVYGGGKFGMVDRCEIASRPEFRAPFSGEMLTLWLIRVFTVDLVEHLARMAAPTSAVPLDRSLRRSLGVGNSTGLGMAPFLVNHPVLFHRWVVARETALARVRAVESVDPECIADFTALLEESLQRLSSWRVDDAVQSARIEELKRDLERLRGVLPGVVQEGPCPFDRVYRFAEAELGTEAQEFVVSLLLEPHGVLVDDLADAMDADEERHFTIEGAMLLPRLATHIETHYSHALAVDFTKPQAKARFWYVSEEKLEPRLGKRGEEEGAERELPLAISRDVAELYEAIGKYGSDTAVAAFLAERPEFRHTVRRVQVTALHPYAEVRDNLIDAAMRPIDLLRCKLSFFGATEFDPRSDRWVRIALFRHAPWPDELYDVDLDDRSESVPPAQESPTRARAGVNQATHPAGGYSASELEALVRKAARGAGLTWGFAEEAGKCARALAEADPEYLAALHEILLAHTRSGLARGVAVRGYDWSAAEPLPLCPLTLGSSFCDHAFRLHSGQVSVKAPILRPVVLVPFLAVTAERIGTTVVLEAQETKLPVFSRYPFKTMKQLAAFDRIGPIRLAIDRKTPLETRRAFGKGRVVGVEGQWAGFEELAALTYVRRSEASRLTGAGAGLSDND